MQVEFARFVNTNKVIRINKHISKLFIKLIINLIKSRNIKMSVELTSVGNVSE